MLEDSNNIEGRMDKKQKEALVLALLEKGETYREIARQAGVSPNTIKAIANKAGLDETTSISSRAFELYSQQRIPSPLIAAIKLGLKTEEAIRYHQEYFMLLGLTEFTRAYLAIKENIWQFLDLVKLVQNARIGNNEVIELLKIANGHLPRVRLEYGRIIDEINWHKAELNSWKAEIDNAVRVYQQFCDRNLSLKNREDELQRTINNLEAKENDLLKTIGGLNQQVLELQNKIVNNNLLLEVPQEEHNLMKEISPNTMVSHQSENDTIDCSSTPSLPVIDSVYQHPSQCKSTKAVIGFS
jgi:hypothetical protein